MWSRRNAFQDAPPIETWPTVSVASLSPEIKVRYQRNEEAIRLYYANEAVASIAERTGVDQRYLPTMARKCLMLAEDGRIFGFRAVVPNIRLKPYQRRAAIKTKFPEAQGGLSGALSNLLERLPNLESELVRWIMQDAKAKVIPEYKLRAKDLHHLFIKCIEKQGICRHEWPFNTKYLGIRTIQKFMVGVLNKYFSKSVYRRGEIDAKAHLAVGTGDPPFLSFEDPYDAVEIDAYCIEAHFTIDFLTPEGTSKQVLLERIWLIAAVERASTAVLAWSFVYRSEVGANDIVALIRDAVAKKWEPLAGPPFTYGIGSGLPSGVIPLAFGAVWEITMLDGALAHLATALHDRVRKTLGMIINWGPVGHFERRPNVERTFRKIGDDVFKRLPSTTGSHPRKGRADDAEAKAIRYGINADDAEKMTDVYFAQHNATPTEGLSYMTPLDYLRYFIDGPVARLIVRHLPARAAAETKLFLLTETHFVRGGKKTGRRPYVQIDRVRYTNPILAEAGHLIGKKVTIEIDEDDMRQVRAFLPNGTELGILKAGGRWNLTKHSRRTRKIINRLAYERIIVLTEFDDPVAVYLAHIGKGVKHKGGIKPPPPKVATAVVHVAKAAGLEPTITAPQEDKINRGKSVNDASKRRSLIGRPSPIQMKTKNHR